VLAETLNCIFDVFADNYAEALHASGLLPLLQQFLPVFTEKVAVFASPIAWRFVVHLS
jgi:hypothetical protein